MNVLRRTLVLATLVLGCSGQPKNSTPVCNHLSGSACTAPADCCDPNEADTCLNGTCQALRKTGQACTRNTDCAYQLLCSAPAGTGAVPDGGMDGGSVCVPGEACEDSGGIDCGKDVALLCTGTVSSAVGSCPQCQSSASPAYTGHYVNCYGDTKVEFAVVGTPCSIERDLACTFGRTGVLECQDGTWVASQSCGGASPRCDWIPAGTNGCTSSAHDGCIGCTN